MPVEDYQEVELTIPAGAAISAAKNVSGPIVAVYIPSGWTAARLGFDIWVTGTTYAPLRTSAGALVGVAGISTSAAGWYAVPEHAATGVSKSIKLTSFNTASEVAVNQVSAMTIKVRFGSRLI